MTNRKAKVTDEHREESARLERLWATRPGLRLSQEEFGQEFGIGNQSAVSQFLKARIPLSREAAAGFVRGLNAAGHTISLVDISPRLARELQAIGEVLPLPDATEFVDVPRKKVGLSAGPGREPHLEDVVGTLKFRSDFLRAVGAGARQAAVVDVIGHSMEPTIPDGAVVLINTANTEPRDRMIYAIRIGSDLLIKRLVKHGDAWVARSDNDDREAFPDLHMNGDDHAVVGRAVWMGTRL